MGEVEIKIDTILKAIESHGFAKTLEENWIFFDVPWGIKIYSQRDEQNQKIRGIQNIVIVSNNKETNEARLLYTSIENHKISGFLNDLVIGIQVSTALFTGPYRLSYSNCIAVNNLIKSIEDRYSVNLLFDYEAIKVLYGL